MYILYSILLEKGRESFCLVEGGKSRDCAKKKKKVLYAWWHHSHGTVASTAALIITQFTFVTPWIAFKSLNTAKVCIRGWAGKKCCTHRTPTHPTSCVGGLWRFSIEKTRFRTESAHTELLPVQNEPNVSGRLCISVHSSFISILENLALKRFTNSSLFSSKNGTSVHSIWPSRPLRPQVASLTAVKIWHLNVHSILTFVAFSCTTYCSFISCSSERNAITWKQKCRNVTVTSAALVMRRCKCWGSG